MIFHVLTKHQQLLPKNHHMSTANAIVFVALRLTIKSMTKNDTSNNSQVAERLTYLMEQNHLSQSDMARIAGVSRSAANRWFSRGSISKDSAAKIAAATNTSLAWILTGEEAKNDGFTEDELALIDVYRELPPIERRNMLAAFQMRLQKLKDFYSDHVDPSTREK
jgi:transcriptional regulator with XRE-family HTH domain